MGAPDHRTPPPRLPGELIVRLVQAHQRGHLHLPIFHADDVLPLLDGDDRDIAAAVFLLDANRIFYPLTPTSEEHPSP